ncbi:Crp/Fnr family transcriptional regulator [Nocardioides massiliensis]|uniref:CRP-like cAMP-binding protein n=1 Tax=Nocardioides massiliensis TaxID=1325935 RepID=A0ABT9NR44_9ACTN|nr:cyclic nucleotide-binding domain-containing protein [Nocardioides massiliensis]MDP9822737.1 CRP-like cAMP-binding protein [Nocardioides massiliensis]
MSQDIAQLKAVSIFEGLSDADVKRIAAGGTQTTVPANWSLMSEKTPADKAYIVLEGELSVRRNGTEIARLGAGDVIGEMGIVEQKLRTASVVSTTPLTVIHFTRDNIDRLCTEVPAFAAALKVAADARRDSTD